MKNRSILLMVSLVLAVAGCATTSDSVILGISVGATAGGVTGANLKGGSNDAGLVGAAIGAIVGGLTGYLIHGGLEKRDEKVRRDTLLNLEKYGVNGPRTRGSQPEDIKGGHALTKPVVDVEWVDTRVDGGKLVEGHRVWRVLENSRWVPEADDKKERKK